MSEQKGIKVNVKYCNINDYTTERSNIRNNMCYSKSIFY